MVSLLGFLLYLIIDYLGLFSCLVLIVLLLVFLFFLFYPVYCVILFGVARDAVLLEPRQLGDSLVHLLVKSAFSND